MESEILKWLSNQTTGVVLAAIVFWFYRKDVKSGLLNWKAQTEILIKTLEDNTQAKTELSVLIQQLINVVEFCRERRPHESADSRGEGH
jgi:hypothetical protein